MIGLVLRGFSQYFLLAVLVYFKQMSTHKYKTKASPAKLSLLSSHMVCLLGYSLLQEMVSVQDMFLFTVRYFTKASFTLKIHLAVKRSEHNSKKHIQIHLNDEVFILNLREASFLRSPHTHIV